MKRDFFISLIAEQNKEGKYTHASIGRISFIVILGIAVYIWTMGTGDIQASHLQMLYITATYNLMKKVQFFGNVKSKDIDIEFTKEDERPPKI